MMGGMVRRYGYPAVWNAGGHVLVNAIRGRIKMDYVEVLEEQLLVAAEIAVLIVLVIFAMALAIVVITAPIRAWKSKTRWRRGRRSQWNSISRPPQIRLHGRLKVPHHFRRAHHHNVDY